MIRQRMLTLLKREYWENRAGFLLTPVVLGGILLVLLIMGWILGTQASEQFAGGTWFMEQELGKMAQMDDASLEGYWSVMFLTVDGIFNLTLFIILFFYLLGTLSDDRKDRSILFWKSMPVTDSETVLSKLLAAMLVAPALMLAAEFITLLLGTVLYWFWLLFLDVPAWRLSLGSAPIASHMLTNAFNYLIHGLWMLPLYGWLLLASAAARRRPFLLATMPLLAIVILENFFSLLSDWSIRDNIITPYIINRFTDGMLPLKMGIHDDRGALSSLQAAKALEDTPSFVALLGRSEMWVGIIIGCLFLAGAIWFRRYREDG